MQAPNYRVSTEPVVLSPEPPVSTLLTELAEHSTALVKSEWQLLILELKEKAGDYQSLALTVGIGASLAFLGLMGISVAVINLLTSYLGLTMAATVYGIGLLLIGSVFIYRGLKTRH